LAKRLFGVPIALLGLVDANRQWFKSCVGWAIDQTPRDISFCGHAILSDEILIVPDARLDERFHDNPLVIGEPGIRFYAGCPLSLSDGHKIGTLCLISQEPRDLGEEDCKILRDLARMVEQEIAALKAATMCELTSLSSRRGFLAFGRHTLSLCARCGIPATISCFDLDGLKSVNDRFGHAEGDRALADFGSMLRSTFRDSDVIGRLGGDEFAVLMANSKEPDSQVALARLQQMVDEHNRSARRGYKIQFSVGVLSYDATRHASIESLLGDADTLMYVRKRQKRSA
jgi:diguanylate cyclase (GGDEF)-like protein